MVSMLPPSAYIRLQDDAEEQLVIRVLEKREQVTVEVNRVNHDLEITAEAVRVIRSKSAIRRGQSIRICYTYIEWTSDAPVGPGQADLLEVGQVRPAFLNARAGRGEYGPAASAASFEAPEPGRWFRQAVRWAQRLRGRDARRKGLR